jgi:hypothetical protein
VCFVISPPATGVVAAAAVAIVTLLAQMLAVRPQLTRRSDTVLAGGEGPRSHAHWVYVGLEIVKVVALFIAGVWLLAA